MINPKKLPAKLREDLVLKPSDKPKLRQSLMTTLKNAEEAKALVREMFLRDLIEKTKAYLKKNNLERIKNQLGPTSVKKIPNEILKTLSAHDMKMYVSMLKDLAATQVSVLKVMDPFDVSKSASAIKQQAAQPKKSFEELMQKEFKLVEVTDDEEEEDEEYDDH